MFTAITSLLLESGTISWPEAAVMITSTLSIIAGVIVIFILFR